MIKSYSYKELTWHDLESPTREEIAALTEKYLLSDIVANDLSTPTMKPRVDLYDHYMYLILHFPSLKSKYKGAAQEIDFVIGRNFLITSRYKKLDSSHAFSKIFLPEHIFHTTSNHTHAGYLFFTVIQELYHDMVDELQSINDSLVAIEKNIFKGKEKKLVIEISMVSRDLLDFKQATNLHKSVLDSFSSAAKTFFGVKFDFNISAITNEYYKVHTALEDSKDFLEELRRTNDSLLSTKQNEIMKTFTVLAFIFLPLSFIASVFGMNIDTMPLVSQPYSFFIILAMMATLGFSIYGVAKYKEWL